MKNLFRWRALTALIFLGFLAGSTTPLWGQDQPDTSKLMEKIRELERKSAASDLKIQALEERLATYESGEFARSELETLVNGILDDDDARVTPRKAEMLKIGGQFRFRGEYRTTKNYGTGVDDGTDFVIQRTRLNFDFRIIENLRAFVELQDSRLWGEEGSVVSDLEGVDIHQAYVDFENAFGEKWTFRVGRQELKYGDQRLISPLDWHPVGRAWDGVRTWFEGDEFQLDAFVTNVREAHPAGERDDDWVFAGAYFHYTGIEDHVLDAYVFYRSYADGSFVNEAGGTGDLEDATFGLHFKGKTGGFSYMAEIVGQAGDRAGDDVWAFAWVAKAGYTFDTDWQPYIGAEWTFASGDDDPTDGDYETFDPLFPFGHAYQGFLDIFAWRNGHDIVGHISVKPREDWWLGVDVHYFLLDSDSDAWYGAAGTPIRRVAAGGVSNDVGLELDIHAKHDLNAATKLWFGYSHFFPGDYVDDTGSSPATDWVYFQMTINF